MEFLSIFLESGFVDLDAIGVLLWHPSDAVPRVWPDTVTVCTWLLIFGLWIFYPPDFNKPDEEEDKKKKKKDEETPEPNDTFEE
jgi:hypothetical protein